jgi:hypothetical protein
MLDWRALIHSLIPSILENPLILARLSVLLLMLLLLLLLVHPLLILMYIHVVLRWIPLFWGGCRGLRNTLSRRPLVITYDYILNILLN